MEGLYLLRFTDLAREKVEGGRGGSLLQRKTQRFANMRSPTNYFAEKKAVDYKSNKKNDKNYKKI